MRCESDISRSLLARVQGSGPDSTVLLRFIMLVVERNFPAANLGPGVEGPDYCKNR
jgi:hypothetical protein